MAADPFFRMTVQEVFSIRDRGTVVTGQIESGTLQVGDEIGFEQQGLMKKVTVAGLEISRKKVQQAKAGDPVGILLREIDKLIIQHGDILTGSTGSF